MSTQYSNSIPFSANHTQQAFKLLELPPELLILLESDAPPTLEIHPSPVHPHHINLNVSNGKTYIIREKHTSNPLMLLSPSVTQPTHTDDDQDISSFIPQPSITRIGSVKNTLELIEKEDKGEGETKTEKPVKVNKWHEKFAKDRK